MCVYYNNIVESREYQITVNVNGRHTVEKTATNAASRPLPIAHVQCALCSGRRVEKQKPKKCESKAKCKKFYSNSSIYSVWSRVSLASMRLVAPSQHAHTHSHTNCHLLISFFVCVCFACVLDCIKRNEILGISAFSVVGWNFWVLRGHKCTPHTKCTHVLLDWHTVYGRISQSVESMERQYVCELAGISKSYRIRPNKRFWYKLQVEHSPSFAAIRHSLYFN